MPPDTALARALALVRDLRARCPWDRVQTRDTLRPYLVEEALELDQALKQDDAARLRDELGDLLLHVAFQIVIGEERGEFDAETVTRALEDKMRRRHPHLFGLGDKPPSWERGKRETRRPRRLAGCVAPLAHGLPAAGTGGGRRLRLARRDRTDGEGERRDRGARGRDAGCGKRDA